MPQLRVHGTVAVIIDYEIMSSDAKKPAYYKGYVPRSTANLTDLVVLVEEEERPTIAHHPMNSNYVNTLLSRPAQVEPSSMDPLDNTAHNMRGKGILASKREIEINPNGRFLRI